MPPSRIGTYSNFTPVRFSIAGIASWVRKALGLPKSNRNCGFCLTALSLGFLYDPYHFKQPSGSRERDQPQRNLSVAAKRAFRQFFGVAAHIRRPVRDQLLETVRVIAEQGAQRVFVMRFVAGHGREKTEGGFLRQPHAIAVLAGPARFVDQSADRQGRTALLP